MKQGRKEGRTEGGGWEEWGEHGRTVANIRVPCPCPSLFSSSTHTHSLTQHVTSSMHLGPIQPHPYRAFDIIPLSWPLYTPPPGVTPTPTLLTSRTFTLGLGFEPLRLIARVEEARFRMRLPLLQLPAPLTAVFPPTTEHVQLVD